MNNTQEKLDFWWLPSDTVISGLRVGLGHHVPITDDDDPRTTPWFRPLDISADPYGDQSLYRLDFINHWRKACNNTNIYRTLRVFDMNSQEGTLGPFLIDVDNSKLVKGNRYVENLANALEVTRNIVNILVGSYNVSTNDIRVFFSGRKGFNIEVRPEVLKIGGSIADQIKLSANRLDAIVRNATINENTNIDKIYGDRYRFELRHPYIRLHSSINSWIGNNGKEIKQMRFELTISELNSLTADKIRLKSEGLVSSLNV